MKHIKLLTNEAPAQAQTDLIGGITGKITDIISAITGTGPSKTPDDTTS